MKLVSLRLKDFRSYGKAEVEFSPTQNYIFGRNWQGKSSIMDGISYALFGKKAFPLKIAGAAVKAEHLVREGAKEATAELTFEHNDRIYSITRTCPKDRPSLSCDGTEIATMSTPVRERLVELLGIDEDLFVNVFYSEQDELRSILEVNPEQRKTFIETVIGFEYLKEVKSAAKHASDSLQKWLDGFTSGNIKTIIEMVKSADDRMGVINERLKVLAGLISELGEPKVKASQAQAAAVEATQKVEDLIETTSSLKAERKQQVELLKGILKMRCPTCGQTISTELKEQLMHKFSHTLEELRGKIEEGDKQLEKVNTELARANTGYATSSSETADLQGFAAERDTLKQELVEKRKDFDRLEKEMAAYGNKQLVFNRIKDEQTFLAELQEAIEDFRVSLRTTLTADLENAVNFFLTKFSDGDFDAQLKINEDFGFEVILHGRPVPIFNLSGAARDILAISLRYGLYRIASKEIQFILLDEPTHHFDPVNTVKLKEALNGLSEQQLIVITVHDEFSDAIGKKFLVEKNDQLASLIREV